VVIEEHSPERVSMPTVITERSRNYRLEQFGAELKEQVVKERLRRVPNRAGSPYQGDYSSGGSEIGPFGHYAGYFFSLSRYTRSR
jgi:hypothetical protein